MSDEKSGLSSYGQQQFDDLKLTVDAMKSLLFEDDPDRLHRERDRIAGIARMEAAPPPPPVGKEDLDALLRQFKDLQNRLDYHAVHNQPPEKAVGPTEPPLPPPPEPPPGDRQPFEGQRPMVPFGGPEPGRSWEQGPRPPESPPAPPPGAWQPPPPPPQAPPPDVPPQHAGGGWGPR